MEMYEIKLNSKVAGDCEGSARTLTAAKSKITRFANKWGVLKATVTYKGKEVYLVS